MRLAATLWAGTEPLDGDADEGPRHLRPAGVRLMPHAPPTSSAAAQLETYFDRTAAEAWARLTSDAPVGRHPRHRARRARPDARARCCPGCPPTCAARACSTPAAAPARSRSRRRGAAPTWSRSTCRRRWSTWRASARPSDLGAGRIDFRVGDMLDPALGRFDHVVAMDSLIHYAAPTMRCARWPAWPRARERSMLFTFAPRTPAARGHARGRPAVPARRPRAGDRAGRRSDAAPR